MKLMESSIPVNYVGVMQAKMLDFVPGDTYKMYDTIVAAASDFLGLVKSKENSTALRIADLKGNFMMAFKVDYTENENPEMPGNWNYSITTSAEDIANCNIYEYTDPQFVRVFSNTGSNLYAMMITDSVYVAEYIMGAIKTLLDWLDVNAKEGEEVTVEEEGYFSATVVVENGEKVIGIVPAEPMKRLVKGDKDTEV